MQDLKITLKVHIKDVSGKVICHVLGEFTTLESVFDRLLIFSNAEEDLSIPSYYGTNCDLQATYFESPVANPELKEHSRLLLVVDAVERGGRDATVINEQKQAVLKQYSRNCVVLEVTSVPPFQAKTESEQSKGADLSQTDGVLVFIQQEWNRLKEKRKLEIALKYRRATWIQAMKTPSSWLSVSNFGFIAAVMLCLGVCIAKFYPEILATVAPVLVGTAIVALSIGAVVFPFFAAWKMYEHYNAWRFDAWKSYEVFTKNYWGPYEEYLQQDWSVLNQDIDHRQQDDQKKGTDYFSSLQKIGYGYYLLSLGIQLVEWGKAHVVQAVLVAVGLMLSAFLMSVGIGFFLGADFSVQLLSPMLNLVNELLSIGLTGLSQVPGLEFLGSIFTTYFGQIVGVALTAALPLIIMDGFRRLGQTIWEGQKAGGYPLWMMDEHTYESDHTVPGDNIDLAARAAAGAFWGEVVEVVKKTCEEIVKPKPSGLGPTQI